MSQSIRPVRPPSFSRPTAASTPAAPPAAARPSQPPAAAPVPASATPKHGHESNEQFDHLQAQHQELVLGRTRFQLLHEQAQERVKQCEEEAAKLGISSLEELQKRIVAAEEEDRRVLEEFQQNLQRERDVQESVNRKLAAISNPT